MPDSRGERCFVYVRYWPGFTPKFPIDRFNRLPEDTIECELRHALAVELCEHRSEITTRRHEEKQSRKSRIEHRQTQMLPLDRALPIVKPRKTRSTRFAKLAYYVGWHESSGPINFLVSPRIWIANVESADVADDLVVELAGLRPTSDDEKKRHLFVKPHYDKVAAGDLTPGDQAHALSETERLRSTQPLDMWGAFAKSLLLRVDGFISAAGPKADKTGALQSTNEHRDAWMYEQKKAGKTHSEIRRDLRKEHSEWEQLDSEQAVGRAVDRYCERNQLPKIRRKSQ